MPDLFFENVHTKNRYKVVGFDREGGTITLLGRHNVPFTEKYSKDRFEEMGYRPVQDDAPSVPPPPAAAVAPPPVSQPPAA